MYNETQMKTADVVIIGGGIIGCSIAWQLSRHNLRVIVLDKQQPGKEASWAAAGMLSPQSDTDSPDDFFRFCMESRKLYPDFAASITEASGVDVEYRTDGTIALAFTDEESEVLKRRAAWQQADGLKAETLTAQETQKFVPSISRLVQLALLIPGDHQVNNRRLTQAVILAAIKSGVEINSGISVDEILIKGNRAIGVRMSDNEISTGVVINAAGSWSGLVKSPSRPSVAPVRGQMIALKSSTNLFDVVVHSPHCYLVPQLDGRILIGSTTEKVGFDKNNTAAGVAGLLSAAIEAIPQLSDLAIDEIWAGLRPGTPDSLPFVGRAKDVDNLLIATGHYRNGILLTPVTAKVMTELALGGKAPELLDAFAPDRLTGD